MNTKPETNQQTTQVLVTGWLRAGEGEALATYQSEAGAILKKHGAEIRLKSKPTQSFSGSKADFVILIDFPDADAASAAFDSPEYHAIVPTRDLALERINIVALG
jgi:uncharacterized protein (DUF1330 family)